MNRNICFVNNSNVKLPMASGVSEWSTNVHMLYSTSLYLKGKRQKAPTTGPPSTKMKLRKKCQYLPISNSKIQSDNELKNLPVRQALCRITGQAAVQ